MSQKVNMKQVPYCVPTNIRYNRTKYSCHGELAPILEKDKEKSYQHI